MTDTARKPARVAPDERVPAGASSNHLGVSRPSTGAPSNGDSLRPVPSTPDQATVEIEFVVPVHNEAAVLERNVRRLHSHLTTELPYRFTLTVADNASTDDTLVLARCLADELPHLRVLHLDAKGRGRALHEAWSASRAEVLAYMDVDLSTALTAVLPLIAPLVSGHSDVAIGTRLGRGSRVVRGPKRELISRCYNVLLRTTLAARFSDAQCGFKAIRADRARTLLPHVQDKGWFFDTELLVLAERAGMRIHEVPVDWVDDPDSRVDIVSTAVADIKGVVRLVAALGTGRLPLAALRETADAEEAVDAPAGLIGQLLRFCAVGAVSTVAYLALFVLLRMGLSAQSANALALLATAVGNTAVNRRITFGVRSRTGTTRHQLQGLVAFGVGLVATAGALAALGRLAPAAGVGGEVVVLLAANLVTTVVRFLLYRSWVFPASRPQSPAAGRTSESSLPHKSPG